MIKVGDKVLVIAGEDKGKEGNVIRVLRDKNKVLVSGINIVTKHQKANAYSEGGRIETEAPISISNVKLVSSDNKDKAKKDTKVKTDNKEAKEVKTTEKKSTAKKTTKTAKKSTKKESGDK